jgi:hypothetical protein
MDNVSFKAKVASSICTDGVSVVGFADSNKSPSVYLTLQRGASPDEDDHQEQYYVELCGQQHGVYGGVLGCEVGRARLVLTLDPRQTHIPAKTICVLNGATESQWNIACRAVELLFKGTPVLVTSSAL